MSKSDFIMKPKVDVCFKGLMQNATVRTGFIAALLGVKPEEILDTELLPSIMEGDSIDSKTGILDVRVRLKTGTQIDMEIQLGPFPLWPERSLFYWSKMYLSQIHKGDAYHVLKKCIHVGILDFILFPEETEYYSRFHLWEDNRRLKYTDKAEIHILELPKLSQYDYPEDELLRWARFLNAERKEEFEMMAKDYPFIGEAYEELMKLSADERERLEYEAREKARLDYNTMMITNLQMGREEGIRQGLKEGIQQGIEQGIEKTTTRYSQLIKILAKDNRVDELIKAADDVALLDKLYAEYGL